mmetsp:Transcript_2893/g.10564  ORF Transcript_2893/g.10564 Transcript_2893/m.10564 type:complete len:206 (+) Transcript_2893:1557-2174(+)
MAIASSASRWRSSDARPASTSESAACTAGTRVPPPMSSTPSSAVGSTPVESRRRRSGAPARSSSGAASFSNCSRVTDERKSKSPWIPSTEMNASWLALKTSLVRRTCFLSLASALGTARMSTPPPSCAFTSSAKCSTSTMSKLIAPRLASHSTPSTSNCPTCFVRPASFIGYELKRTSAVSTLELPMSYRITSLVAFVKSLSMPH